jgi:hypothetical protein
MSRDPFEHLQAQLRAAIVRRRRWPSWRRPAGLALLGIALAGGGVAVAAGVFSADGPSPAARAVAAGERTALNLPVCAVRSARDIKPRLVAGAVPPSVRAQFAVFRRPARAEDLAAFKRRLRSFGGRDVLRSGIRITRAPTGRRYALAISYGPRRFQQRDPVGCLAETKKAALAQPQAADTKVRERIHVILKARERRAQDLLSGRSQYLTVDSLIDKTHRSGGGSGTIIRNGRVPVISSRSAGGVPHKVRIDGLVPDDVHDIQVIDRDGSPRSRSVTVPVSGNVYDAELPRRMGPGMTLRWRDRDGRILRRRR